jgi:hypothetical protein
MTDNDWTLHTVLCSIEIGDYELSLSKRDRDEEQRIRDDMSE